MSGMLTGWLGYFSDGWTERVAQMRVLVVFLVTLAAFVWFIFDHPRDFQFTEIRKLGRAALRPGCWRPPPKPLPIYVAQDCRQGAASQSSSPR